MPIPEDLKPFFSSLVAKSKKLEINWEATGNADSFRVTFSDFAIGISQEGSKPVVRIQLLNDTGDIASEMTVDDGDDDWLGALSLINTAKRKVTKIDRSLQRAMEELGKEGTVGLEPAS
jgi:hypothetical protein